jgi:hypothetical protein
MFNYEHLPNIEAVHEAIMKCESRHTQQCVFSTFHDALTQICYGCMKIRTTIFVEIVEDNMDRSEV